jgi:integrase/recombinase XerD
MLLEVSTDTVREVLMLCHSTELDIGPGGDPITVSQLLDEYAAYGFRVRDLAEDTVKQRRLYIDRFLATEPISSKGLASLTVSSVQRFMFGYAEEHGPGSVRWMQSSLRTFLRFCYHHGYVSSDLSTAVPIFRAWRLSKVPRAIDEGTIQRLLESIDPVSPNGLRDLAIIELLVTYGVRGIQIRQLRLEDVDWAGSRLHFRAVKGGRAIDQHLTPEVGNSLLAYIRDARPNDSPYAEIFLSSRTPSHPFMSSGPLSSIIANRLRRIDAQLPKGVSHGTHSFRHAFAARLTGEVPFKHIADMLGHRDLSSTFLYSKVNFKALGEAAQPWPVEVEE